MGKTMYNRAKEFLKNLKEQRGEVLEFDDFKKEVITKLGADEKRTTKPYMKLMLDMKLVSSENEGQEVRINV